MRYSLLLCALTVPGLAWAQEPVVLPEAPDADVQVAEPLIDSWEQVDPAKVEALLEAFLNDPVFLPGKTLSDALLAPKNDVLVVKHYPAQPYLAITFTRGEGRRVDPRIQLHFLREVLGKKYFSPQFVQTVGDWTSPPNLSVNTAAVAPPVTVKVIRYSPFDVPVGLTMPWRRLMWYLGYLPGPDSTLSVAFTPVHCREMAIKAMYLGLYDDAIVLANHGLRGKNSGDPTFLYLRAVCEVHLGRSEIALETLQELRLAGGIPLVMQERLRGPATVHVRLAFGALDY